MEAPSKRPCAGGKGGAVPQDAERPCRETGGSRSGSPARGAGAYVSPRLVSLGTLAELTLGGDVGSNSDGFGNAGAAGSLMP